MTGVQTCALPILCTKEEREKYIEEIQDSIQIYEAMVKTGNDVLDTILTEKSLACKANNIVVSCVADGEGLEFLHPVDRMQASIRFSICCVHMRQETN